MKITRWTNILLVVRFLAHCNLNEIEPKLKLGLAMLPSTKREKELEVEIFGMNDSS